MKSERAKIILVVVLFLAAAGIYWKFGRSPEPLTGDVDFVCVATGEIFSFPRDDLPSVLPGRNRKTGQDTLLPAAQRNGNWFVQGQYAALLRDPEQLGKVNKYVDPQTLEVLKSPR